jgi:glycosyltransferase involved in cell wall biosynthesis
MRRASVLLLGPDRGAISGVATHLNLLFGSELARRFGLEQFRVGSEGRAENGWRLLVRLAASPLQLIAAIARCGAEVVHINTSLSPKAFWRDLLYVAAAKACGARVVYQVHGGSLPELGRSGPMRHLLRVTLQWPDVIVVLARSELEEMRALVPRQQVVLVPNAIDCASFVRLRHAAPQARTRLKLLHLGRLVRVKGIFEMVQALAAARRMGVAASLVIAGDGPDLPALKSLVAELHLESEVTFAGPAFGSRKLGLLGEADVLLLPTYHREGLPYALLEAMAAGLVPVATRVGAIPDVAAEGVHALFVPPRDPEAIARAIAVLAADRARLARMSAACRERVAACYSVERLAEDFTALYRKLQSRSWAPSRAG